MINLQQVLKSYYGTIYKRFENDSGSLKALLCTWNQLMDCPDDQRLHAFLDHFVGKWSSNGTKMEDITVKYGTYELLLYYHLPSRPNAKDALQTLLVALLSLHWCESIHKIKTTPSNTQLSYYFSRECRQLADTLEFICKNGRETSVLKSFLPIFDDYLKRFEWLGLPWISDCSTKTVFRKTRMKGYTSTEVDPPFEFNPIVFYQGCIESTRRQITHGIGHKVEPKSFTSQYMSLVLANLNNETEYFKQAFLEREEISLLKEIAWLDIVHSMTKEELKGDSNEEIEAFRSPEQLTISLCKQLKERFELKPSDKLIIFNQFKRRLHSYTQKYLKLKEKKNELILEIETVMNYQTLDEPIRKSERLENRNNYMNKRQLARYIHKSERTITNWERNGYIINYGKHGRPLYLLEEVIHYIESLKVKSL